ncbi:MAG: hypothetical protein EPN97_05125 [Alphaproteobacteria bacterium]|nr:MAG: hypothetical protein EPN97_05125 [Alphaproteobacteria bacterium]
MTPKADTSQRNRDIREVLAASRRALKTAQKELPTEPEELEETPDMNALYGMVANGCGKHEAAIETADFISPLLLAA